MYKVSNPKLFQAKRSKATMASRKSQREGPPSRSGQQLEPNPLRVPVEFNIFGKGMFEFDSDNENSIDDLSTPRSNSITPEEEDINLTHHRRRSLPRVPSNASEGDQVSNSSDQNPQPSLGWPLAARTERLFRARIKKPATAMKVQIINKTQDEKELSEMEMMKERFSKLLLGEDMSGGGKGVSSALAISNAITNLAASIFTELSKLEPLAPERKTMWCREIGWFLSVVDHIVEFVPSSQHSVDGSNMEIMVTKPRSDLQMNIPALRKLDAMLLETLEKFKEAEFWYVNKSMEGDAFRDNCKQQRQEHKWWLPTPHVPPGGLSRNARKILQSQRESVNQILKAAMAINAQVLSEMEIPDAYLESLPKAARASLGDTVYRHITSDQFSAEGLLSSLDLSSEHNILDIMNRIEASIAIWKRKINKECKNNAMSSWGTSHSDKKELFGERAESLLLLLKLRFRGLPQTALDMSKIQYNKDVGQSILESYSRVLESLAYNILSRIDDVLYADNLNKRVPSRGCYERNSSSSSIATNSLSEYPSSHWSASPSPGYHQSPDGSPKKCQTEMQVVHAEHNHNHSMQEVHAEHNHNHSISSSPSVVMTLSDHIGWQIVDHNPDNNCKLKLEDLISATGPQKSLKKLPDIITSKRGFIERLEDEGAVHSPAARD